MKKAHTNKSETKKETGAAAIKCVCGHIAAKHGGKRDAAGRYAFDISCRGRGCACQRFKPDVGMKPEAAKPEPLVIPPKAEKTEETPGQAEPCKNCGEAHGTIDLPSVEEDMEALLLGARTKIEAQKHEIIKGGEAAANFAVLVFAKEDEPDKMAGLAVIPPPMLFYNSDVETRARTFYSMGKGAAAAAKMRGALIARLSTTIEASARLRATKIFGQDMPLTEEQKKMRGFVMANVSERGGGRHTRILAQKEDGTMTEDFPGRDIFAASWRERNVYHEAFWWGVFDMPFNMDEVRKEEQRDAGE